MQSEWISLLFIIILKLAGMFSIKLVILPLYKQFISAGVCLILFTQVRVYISGETIDRDVQLYVMLE